MKHYICSLLLSLSSIWAFSQCPLPNAIIYESTDPQIDYGAIAEACAPILWFSADEPNLYDAEGNITLPRRFPFDNSGQSPNVYYKVKEVFTPLSKVQYNTHMNKSVSEDHLDLRIINRMEVEFYCYYETEQGAGSHPHDLEAILFQIAVHQKGKCNNDGFVLEVKRVIAKAHGQYWFNNSLNVDQFTTFPMSILIEEGKHANCIDKNGDGVYTPGYDVNEKPNDAWGVRDIISTGVLFSGGYQGWMSKNRNAESAVHPETFKATKTGKRGSQKIQEIEPKNTYSLTPFPQLPTNFKDEKLVHMIKGKKPNVWPRTSYRIKNTKTSKVEKENTLRNKLGFSLTMPEGALEISMPFLLVKHVQAPMTGGWFYHKVYFSDAGQLEKDLNITRIGYQLRHSNSASRWIDSYVGLGFEGILGDNTNQIPNDFEFVSEIGLKIRLNITVTPLKFLKFLGTDYWGISLGWRNRGFELFNSGSFIITIGAGAF